MWIFSKLKGGLPLRVFKLWLHSVGNLENLSKLSIRKWHVVSALFAGAMLVFLWILLSEPDGPVANQRVYQGKTLQDWFSQLQGHDGDPVIATFRDIGPDAVALLGAQLKKRDSVFKRGYLALWPRIPAFLKSSLKQPTDSVPIRVKAVGALRRMGLKFTQSEPVMTILIEALSDPSEEVRSIAEGALGDIGPRAKATVPALIKSVERRGLSINGVWALGRIGPEASASVPLLKTIVKRDTGRELVYAAEALWRIEPDNSISVPALIKGLGDSNPQARAEAAEAVGLIGEPAKAAVSILTEALGDSDQRVRLNAARALVRIGRKSEDAVNTLSAMLSARTPSRWDGIIAAETLLTINPDSELAIAYLTERLKDHDAPVLYDELLRLHVAVILVKAGREIELVMPVLLKAANGIDVNSKQMAIRALGQLGSKARAAIPLLKDAVQDKDAEVQKAAADSLKRIEGDLEANQRQ